MSNTQLVADTSPEKIVVVDYHILHPTYMTYYVNGNIKGEFEYHPEEQGMIITDKKLFEALQNLVGDETDIVIDISATAASFIEHIKRNSDYKINRYGGIRNE